MSVANGRATKRRSAGGSDRGLYAKLSCALAERDAVTAKNALIASGENPPFHEEAVHFNRPLVEGVIARMTKDEDKACAAFTAARAEQEKIVQAQPNYGPALCVLGLIDASLGRKEEALGEGRRAVELLPVEKDAISGPLMIEYLTMIAAWIGDKDLACEQLLRVISPPSTHCQLWSIETDAAVGPALRENR